MATSADIDDAQFTTLLQLVVCPECHGVLDLGPPSEASELAARQAFQESPTQQLSCAKCDREFPILKGGIPVLWSDVLKASLLSARRSVDQTSREAVSEHDVKAANFDVYEAVIGEYETKKIHSNSVTNDRLHAALRDFEFRPGAVQVDVGCGPGNVLEATPDDVFTLKIGCDISVHALRVTKAKGFAVVLGDAERLPFRDETVDLITGYSLLHHLYDPSRFMAEAFRTLRARGGLVTDFDPNKHSAAYGPMAMLVFRARKYVYCVLPGAHKSRFGRNPQLEESNRLAEFHNAPGLGFDPEKLRSTLSQVGFEVLHIGLHNTLESTISYNRYCKPRLANFTAQLLSFRNPALRKYADTVLTSSRKPQRA
jgi:ubiquinone/menaquinone biosynthesis C-methylase UbiE/uncharacterized protein YbaR (Trm112 family)